MRLNQSDSLLIMIDVQEKLTPHVKHSEALLTRIDWLLHLAQCQNIPTLITEQYPKGLGETHHALKPRIEGLPVLSKLHFSAWREKSIEDFILKTQRQQLVLCGIESHVCVLQTALDCFKAGYDVFVVEDAVSSRSLMDKECAIHRMRRLGIHVISSEMALFEWADTAGTPEFKALSDTFLKSKS